VSNSDFPPQWERVAQESPERWATWVAHMDQAYSRARDELDKLVDRLIRDINARPTHRQFDDAQGFTAFTIGLDDAIKNNGGISSDLLSVFVAGVYRLARQRISEMSS